VLDHARLGDAFIANVELAPRATEPAAAVRFGQGLGDRKQRRDIRFWLLVLIGRFEGGTPETVVVLRNVQNKDVM
jgi:hypothetical protein